MAAAHPLPAWTLALGALLTSCGASRTGPGPRSESNYRHPEYPFEVQLAPESPNAFLGPEWKAESLRLVHGELPPNPPPSHSGEQVEQLYDWNDDGTSDSRESLPRYELKLSHHSGASIFIRAVPVPEDKQAESLADLANHYLNSVGREGNLAARLGPNKEAGDEGQPPDVLGQGACRVAGVAAHRLEVVTRNPDGSPKRRARLVLVRPGYRHRVADVEGREVPVMLVAAYSHGPDEFESLEDDFNLFLGRLVLGGYGEAVPGAEQGHNCRP